MAKRIELWSLEKLKPYKKNARTHDEFQISQIAASIVEFGFVNPILVDEEDGILAGHGRYLAAESLGMTEVPVIPLTHLSENQKKAYILADNKLALNAGWDMSLLREEITELDLEDFTLPLIGFDDQELSTLLEPESLEEGYDQDGVTELGEEDFNKFDHECPRCGFEFNDKN